MNETTNSADKLRALADQIESKPQAREEIAAAFRLIADAMLSAPCTDCGSQQGQALAPEDKQEAGAEEGVNLGQVFGAMAAAVPDDWKPADHGEEV